jgi:hypothetical protein
MRSPLCTFLLFGAALALARGADAQTAHGMVFGPRPLQMRVAEADVVAIGRIAAIEPGRIAVHDAVALRGAPGASFEIKRAPSKPPPLALGQQAVLLLRGARSPYVLVDDPKELIALRDDASARVFEEALGQLLDAGSDPDRLLAVYLAWLDVDDAALRGAAGAALVDVRSKLGAPSAAQALARARVALDASQPIELRRVSVRVATRDPAATGALLAGTPDALGDPGLVELVLSAGALQKSPPLDDALGRALASEDVEVRRAALRASENAWSNRVEGRVRELAESEPDPSLRQDAKQALAEHAPKAR